MSYFIRKNSITLSVNKNIKEILLELNIILSNLYNEYKNILFSVKEPDNMLEFKINDIIVESNIILSLNIIPYLLLNKDLLSKLSQNDLYKLIKLDPEFLLNVITYDKCLINPYYLLIKLININEEALYQTFILYLNKSISCNTEMEKIDLTNITKTFLINCDNKICTEYTYKKYDKLLTYYISAKKITPFMIKFTPYSSLFYL